MSAAGSQFFDNSTKHFAHVTFVLATEELK